MAPPPPSGPGEQDRQASPSQAAPSEPDPRAAPASPAHGDAPAAPPRLELLTRKDCHLCDEMKALLAAVLPTRGFAYTTVDVDTDLALKARFGNTVPVLLRDGHPVAKVRLDEPTLLRILARHR